MSEENVEIWRSGYEPWRRGEFDAWLETIDPDIGWDISAHPLPDVPNHGRGGEALLTDMGATYLSGWNDYSSELKELIDAGDHVVAVMHETAKMSDTGVALDRDLRAALDYAGRASDLLVGVPDEGRDPRSRRAVGVVNPPAITPYPVYLPPVQVQG
jgi:ketosteroid isomerase-like protein